MISIESSAVIGRPVDDVWAFVADPHNEPTWHTDILDIRPEAEPSGQLPSRWDLGSRWLVTVQFMGRKQHVVEITGLEPNRRVEITTRQARCDRSRRTGSSQPTVGRGLRRLMIRTRLPPVHRRVSLRAEHFPRAGSSGDNFLPFSCATQSVALCDRARGALSTLRSQRRGNLANRSAAVPTLAYGVLPRRSRAALRRAVDFATACTEAVIRSISVGEEAAQNARQHATAGMSHTAGCTGGLVVRLARRLVTTFGGSRAAC
jgi:hypothetical protein